MKVYEAVRMVIREQNVKQKTIAERMNMQESVLSAKLNGKRNLYADELAQICKILTISADEILLRARKAGK